MVVSTYDWWDLFIIEANSRNQKPRKNTCTVVSTLVRVWAYDGATVAVACERAVREQQRRAAQTLLLALAQLAELAQLVENARASTRTRAQPAPSTEYVLLVLSIGHSPPLSRLVSSSRTWTSNRSAAAAASLRRSSRPRRRSHCRCARPPPLQQLTVARDLSGSRRWRQQVRRRTERARAARGPQRATRSAAHRFGWKVRAPPRRPSGLWARRAKPAEAEAEAEAKGHPPPYGRLGVLSRRLASCLWLRLRQHLHAKRRTRRAAGCGRATAGTQSWGARAVGRAPPRRLRQSMLGSPRRRPRRERCATRYSASTAGPCRTSRLEGAHVAVAPVALRSWALLVSCQRPNRACAPSRSDRAHPPSRKRAAARRSRKTAERWCAANGRCAPRAPSVHVPRGPAPGRWRPSRARSGPQGPSRWSAAPLRSRRAWRALAGRTAERSRPHRRRRAAAWMDADAEKWRRGGNWSARRGRSCGRERRVGF